MKVILRPFIIDSDAGAIMKSWPSGAYFSSVVPIKENKKKWHKNYYDYVLKHLNLGNITIACLQEDTNTIVGYCVMYLNQLEWISVKKEYRNNGIARMLLNNKNIQTINTTNLTKIGAAILKNHPEFLNKEKQDGQTKERRTNNE